MIGAGGSCRFAEFCGKPALAEMTADARFRCNAARPANLEAMNAMLSNRLGTKTRDGCMARSRHHAAMEG
jgi:crotonobetainyl-CoA:carnitine CoA-transferase CaiB-like acyl-CoA transferase